MPQGIPVESAALLRSFPKCLIQQLMSVDELPQLYHWAEFNYVAILICRSGWDTDFFTWAHCHPPQNQSNTEEEN